MDLCRPEKLEKRDASTEPLVVCTPNHTQPGFRLDPNVSDMSVSPLSQTLHSLLIRHHDSLHDLTLNLPAAVSMAQDERLTDCLESYLDHLLVQLRQCEKLIADLGPLQKEQRDTVMEQLAIEATAVMELEAPTEVLDVLLARAFLRIQHIQISSIGVIQAIADGMGEREIVKFSREAISSEYEAEEELSDLLEESLVGTASEVEG